MKKVSENMKVNISLIINIFSIIFQAVGAILLIPSSFKPIIIRNSFSGPNPPNLKSEYKEEYISKTQNAYITRISTSYIIIGFILQALGLILNNEILTNIQLITICGLILLCLLLFMGKNLPVKLANNEKLYEKFWNKNKGEISKDIIWLKTID
ncbi:MAG: hypothetical protein ACI8WT_004396 [Clostridium sp.]|jgi:hypothetical protein